MNQNREVFCTKCGSKIPADTNFCAKCGNKIPPENTRQPQNSVASASLSQQYGALNSAQTGLQPTDAAEKPGISKKTAVRIAAAGGVILIIIILFCVIKPFNTSNPLIGTWANKPGQLTITYNSDGTADFIADDKNLYVVVKV